MQNKASHQGNKLMDKGFILKEPFKTFFGLKGLKLVIFVTTIAILFCIFSIGIIRLLSNIYEIILSSFCTNKDPTAQAICRPFTSLGVFPLLLVGGVLILKKLISPIYKSLVIELIKDGGYELYSNKLIIIYHNQDIEIIFKEDDGDIELKSFKVYKSHIQGYLINLKNIEKYKEIIAMIGSNYLFLTSSRDLKIDIKREDMQDLKKSFYKKDGLLHYSPIISK